MQPFNLEKAMAGNKISTADGREVKFLAYAEEADEGHQVIVLLDGKPKAYFKNGRFFQKGTTDMDLHMAPEEITIWLNCYPDGNASTWPTKEKADKYAEHSQRIGEARPFTYTID
jgi:hypothetical protein